MGVLHLIKSEPDETVELLVDAMTATDEESTVEALYLSEIDWARIVEEIFKSDKVISWW